jgi:hypothetical protein
MVVTGLDELAILLKKYCGKVFALIRVQGSPAGGRGVPGK